MLIFDSYHTSDCTKDYKQVVKLKLMSMQYYIWAAALYM